MKISWITLRVKDLEASKAFYGGLLGMEHSRAFGKPDGPQFAFFTDGNGMEVELMQSAKQPAGDKAYAGVPVSFGFQTDAYEDILAKATEAGLNVRGPMMLGGHLEAFFVEDPDGFSVQVMKG